MGFRSFNLSDRATRDYAKSLAQGLDQKASVRAVATSNVTLSGAQTVDGVALVAGDRVLAAAQSTASENGIYVVGTPWHRAEDADTSAKVTSGMAVPVAEGTTYGDTLWALTTDDPISLGSTALAFSFAGLAATTAPADVTKAVAQIGSSSRLARSDHKHNIATAAPVAIGVANAEGTSSSLARADHVHSISAYHWTWANAAERVAQAVSASEVGRVGYQADMATEHQLMSQVSGVGTWARRPWLDVFALRHAVAGFDNNAGGMGTATTVASGTASSLAGAGTTKSTRIPRHGATSAGTAGALALWRSSSLTRYWYGSTFRFVYCAVLGTVVADERYFLGLSGTVPASNIDPATQINSLGLGRSGAGENASLMHNDGSGLATKIDLGASFPGAVADTGYELEAYFNGSVWCAQVRHVDSGAEVSHTLTSNLPTDGTSIMLTWANNNTTASAVRMDFAHSAVGVGR